MTAQSLFSGEDFDIASAGTHAVSGSAATARMQSVAAEFSLDLSGHQATPLDAQTEPDVAFGMEQHHLIAIRERFPDLDASRIRLLDHPVAIVDPYGQSLDSYRKAASHIQRAVVSLDAAALR